MEVDVSKTDDNDRGNATAINMQLLHVFIELILPHP